ncbi:MAG: nitroreductase family protein [Burkholderiales bacterium]|nr:nitroreductase family protein [Burkholderiales bacterium]
MDNANDRPVVNPALVLDLIRSRRSIRGFDQNREVPDEILDAILDAARWAPSAGNGQPTEFIVVRAAETRNRIADLYVKQSADKKEMEKAVRGFIRLPGAGFRHAPVHVIVIGDPRVNECYPVRTILDKGERHFTTSLATATYLLHLMAASFGLGSQYVSDAGSHYMATMLKAMLHIPEPYQVYELIAIGYPTRWPDAPPRRPLADIVHREQYDQAKFRSNEQLNEFLQDVTRLGAFGKSKGRRDEGDAAPEDER